jgi:hypothetical protein
MAKISGKNALILVGGYALSTYASAYEVSSEAGPVEVTGFGDGSKNFIPGLPSAQMSVDMMWDSAAGAVHTALASASSTGIATIVPEGYVLGNNSLSMPYLKTTYSPKSSPEARIDVGSIVFVSSGDNVGIENGWMLAHATITNTATGTGVLDPADAAVTGICGASLHIWLAAAADTYVVKVQHSTNNSTWADLITFTANGSALTSERQTVASGTINKYRRVIATRTGAAANPFGYSVHFWHRGV